MRKRRKVAIGAACCAAVLAVGAVVVIGGAANREVLQLPAQPSEGTDTGPVDPAAGAEAKTDMFDNVEKKAGEQAGLVDEKTGKTYFRFTIAKARLLDSCPDRLGGTDLKPEGLKFLVLDIEAWLDENAGTGVGGSQDEFFMPLLAEAFSVVDTKGALDREVASETAWGCYADSRLAPALINPGETVRGKVVLDVAVTEGNVAYDPERTGGWSWPFGS